MLHLGYHINTATNCCLLHLPYTQTNNHQYNYCARHTLCRWSIYNNWKYGTYYQENKN